MRIDNLKSSLENLFVINDIDLEIPPTQITIQQEDTYWSWKTLRSKISTKTPTTHGVLNVELNMIFVPSQLITLHRLLVEVRNSPFIYVHNAYLRQNIWGHLSLSEEQAMMNMAFVVTSVNVASVQEHPGTFQVGMSLRWFNYFPYSTGFQYKSDWLTMPTPDPNDPSCSIQRTIETVTDRALITSQVPIYTKAKTNQYVQSYSVIKERVESQRSTVDLTSMLIMHAGSVYDLKGLPAPMVKASPSTPTTSNIYKRYINYLQQKSLFENFEIDLFDLFHDIPNDNKSIIQERYGNCIYNLFTSGIRDPKSRDIKADANVNSPLIVRGWHEEELPKEIKGFVLMKMVNSMHETRMYYEEYIKINRDPSLIDLEMDIEYSKTHGIRQAYQNGLKASTVTEIGNINSEGVLGGDLNEYNTRQREAKAQAEKNGNLEQFPSAETDKGQLMPNDPDPNERVFHNLFTHRFENGTIVADPDFKSKINSGFGWRWRSYPNASGKKDYWQFHSGIDLSRNYDKDTDGTSSTRVLVNAPMDGVIVKIGHSGGGGNYILIKHSDELTTGFHHLAEEENLKAVFQDEFGILRKPKEGDTIKRGTPFAVMGNTGASTGAHLHFEVKLNGKTVDPVPYLISTSYDVAAIETGNESGMLEHYKNAYGLGEKGDEILSDMMLNQMEATYDTYGNTIAKGVVPGLNYYYSYIRNDTNKRLDLGLTDLITYAAKPLENYFPRKNFQNIKYSSLIEASRFLREEESSTQEERQKRMNNIQASIEALNRFAISKNSIALIPEDEVNFYRMSLNDLFPGIYLNQFQEEVFPIDQYTDGVSTNLDNYKIYVDLFFLIFPSQNLDRKYLQINKGSANKSLLNSTQDDLVEREIFDGYIPVSDPFEDNKDPRLYKLFMNARIPKGTVKVPISDLFLEFASCEIDQNNIAQYLILGLDISDDLKDIIFEQGFEGLAKYSEGKLSKSISYEFLCKILGPNKTYLKIQNPYLNDLDSPVFYSVTRNKNKYKYYSNYREWNEYKDLTKEYTQIEKSKKVLEENAEDIDSIFKILQKNKEIEKIIAIYNTAKQSGSVYVDPNYQDLDQDGLSDQYEDIFSKTDKLNPDTDGDGYTDYIEVGSGTDPNNPNIRPTWSLYTGTPFGAPGFVYGNTIITQLTNLSKAVAEIWVEIDKLNGKGKNLEPYRTTKEITVIRAIADFIAANAIQANLGDKAIYDHGNNADFLNEIFSSNTTFNGFYLYLKEFLGELKDSVSQNINLINDAYSKQQFYSDEIKFNMYYKDSAGNSVELDVIQRIDFILLPALSYPYFSDTAHSWSYDTSRIQANAEFLKFITFGSSKHWEPYGGEDSSLDVQFSAKSFFKKEHDELSSFLNAYLSVQVSEEMFDNLFIIGWFRDYKDVSFAKFLNDCKVSENYTSNIRVRQGIVEDLENENGYVVLPQDIQNATREMKYDSPKHFETIKEELYKLFMDVEAWLMRGYFSNLYEQVLKLSTLDDSTLIITEDLNRESYIPQKVWRMCLNDRRKIICAIQPVGDTDFFYESNAKEVDDFEKYLTSKKQHEPFFDSGTVKNYTDNSYRYVVFNENLVKLIDLIKDEAGETVEEEIVQEKARPPIEITAENATPQQLNAIEAMRDLIADLMKEGWTPYMDRSGVTDVMKRVVSVSYGNPNFHNNMNLSQFVNFVESNQGTTYELYLKRVIDQLMNYEPQLIEKREQLTYYKEVIVSRVTGGFQHIVSMLPISGHEFPTAQHLGSIEPFYEIEFARMPNLGEPYEMSESAEILSRNLSQLQANAKKFRKVPDCHSFSLDSFMTRLLGSFKATDYDVNEENPLDNKLYKRIIAKRHFSQTIPGSPGLSTMFLSLEETNCYDAESSSYTNPIEDLTSQEEEELPSIKERIKEALEKLYFRKYTKDGQVLSYLNKFAEIKYGSDATKYLVDDLGMSEEDAKKYSTIAVLSDGEKLSKGLSLHAWGDYYANRSTMGNTHDIYQVDPQVGNSISFIDTVTKETVTKSEEEAFLIVHYREYSGDQKEWKTYYFGSNSSYYYEYRKGLTGQADELIISEVDVEDEYFDQISNEEGKSNTEVIDGIYEHFNSFSETGEVEYLSGDRYSKTKVINIEPISNSLDFGFSGEHTGEIRSLDVEKYRSILVDTLRQVRMNMTEEECGGLPTDQVRESLFNLDLMDDGASLTPSRWKTFFAFSYLYMYKGLMPYLLGGGITEDISPGSEIEDDLTTHSRAMVQKINYLLGYDLLDLDIYFSTLSLPGVYDNVPGFTTEEGNLYANIIGQGQSGQKTVSAPSNFDSGSGRSNLYDLNKVTAFDGTVPSNDAFLFDTERYRMALYDEDEAYLLKFLNSNNTDGQMFFSNAMDTIGEDKSVVANFVDIFSYGSGERDEDQENFLYVIDPEVALRAFRFAMAGDGIAARANKLEQYSVAKVGILKDYTKMLGDNFLYENLTEEYLPNLAPYFSDKSNASFSRNLLINKDLKGCNTIFSKLFSPRALLGYDASYVAWSSSARNKFQNREQNSFGQGLVNGIMLATDEAGRNFTSGFAGTQQMGTSGAMYLVGKVTGSTAVATGTSIGIGAKVAASLTYAATLGTATAVGEAFGSQMAATFGNAWTDDLLIEANTYRSEGGLSAVVDDWLLGSDTKTFFDPENSFQGSMGQGDIRINPTKIKTIDVGPLADKSSEEAKLKMFVDTLTELGKTIISNPTMCQILGIDESQYLEEEMFTYGATKGAPAYPDMELPTHPYYNDSSSFATNPDFYMWNIYEDGNANLYGEELNEIKRSAEISIANSYNHLKRMQGGGIVSKTDRNIVGGDQVEGNAFRSTLAHQPEGSSIILNGSGVEFDEEIGTFTGFTKITGKDGELFDKLSKGEMTDEEKEKYKEKEKFLNNLSEGKTGYIPALKLDNFDSNGLDVRTAVEVTKYGELFTKIASIESMFSTKSGYSGIDLQVDSEGFIKEEPKENANPEGLDTQKSAAEMYMGMFNFNSVKKLCEDSAVDILAHSRTMRRAYPTFKMFFIEEDEQETRFRNFDDFYSYNGVKEITVNRDRDTGIDTAILILQNVSGTLDGTKKNSTVDADFFDAKKKKAKANYEGGNQIDQRFDSLLLRPGVNVQLRMGFSNNPNNLEVMISGCISDISWSKAGELCEIVVQSFGAELQQHIKGALPSNDAAVSFPTTHHLLSSLMLSSELKHFGRWEFNDITQYGESSNAKLDVFKYKAAKKIGWFHYGWASGVGSFITDNAGSIAAAILATAVAGTFFALGKPAKGAAIADDIVKGVASVADDTGSLVDNAGELVLKTEQVALQVSDDVAEAAAGGARKTFEFVNPKKVPGEANKLLRGVFNILRPAALSAGRNTNKLSGLAGGRFPFSPLQSFGRLFREDSFIGKTLNWLGGAGTNTKGLGYSDEVLESLDDVVKALNGGKQSIDDVLTVATKAEEAVEKAANAGQRFRTEGVKKATQNLKEVVEKFTKGAADDAAAATATTADDIIKAQQEVLAALNKMQRGNRLDAMLGGNLSAWVAAEGAIGAMTKAGLGAAWNAFANIYIGSVLSGGTVLGVMALAAENVWRPIEGNIKSGNAHYREEYMRTKAAMLLQPQDDNIFSPNPMTYIRLEDKKYEEDWLLGMVKAIREIDLTGMIDWTAGTALNAIYENFYNKKKAFEDKRVPFGTADYFVTNSSIWEMFREMTYRHPGWCHAAVPYGNSFRYTKFFGIPSQRYWSKPVPPGFIYRSNRLREFLSKDVSTFSLKNIEDNWKRLYGEEDWKAAYNEAAKFLTSYDIRATRYYKAGTNVEIRETRKLIYDTPSIGPTAGRTSLNMNVDEFNRAITPTIVAATDSYIVRQSIAERVSNPYEEYDSSENYYVAGDTEEVNKAELGIKLKNKAMQEYLTGLESRFIPFRRYHTIDSDKNLIRNNIIASNKNVVNAVAVHYKDEDEEELKVLEMKASSTIEDSDINEANIAEFAHNIKSKEMALRYGQGSLIYGMKEMYRGELMILGNPRIKPWDICYLFDHQNDMFGPIEVKAVTHMFSHETGFITEIVPNAVVIGNEVSSTPIIDGLKLFLAAVREKEYDADLRKSRFRPDLKELMLDGTFGIVDARYSQDLSQKYKELSRQGVDFETIWSEIPDEDKEVLKLYTKEELFEYLTGIASWKMKALESLDSLEGPDQAMLAGIGAGGLFGGYALQSLYMNRTSGINSKKLSYAERALENNREAYRKLLAERAKLGILGNTDKIDDAITRRLDLIERSKEALKKIKFKGKSQFARGLFLGVGAAGMASLLNIGLESDGDQGTRGFRFNTNSMSLTDELLDGDIKYLASSPILFSKFMEQEAVQVIPLIKDGNPIVSGMSLRDPMAFWQNTLGVLTNKLNDQIRGYSDYNRMSMKYKHGFYRRFEELRNQVIDDIDRRTIVKELLEEEGLNKDVVQIAKTEQITKWFKDLWR